MPNRDEFIKFTKNLREVSPTITKEQRIGLLRKAVDQYGLAVDEADDILKFSKLVVGEEVNYFEVLRLSIAEIENQSEANIETSVKTAHQKLYDVSLNAGARPRPDGRTQEQWRTLLNQARDTLKDAQKRSDHIATLQAKEKPIEVSKEKSTNIFSDSSTRPILKFPNGEEATNIQQLVILMEKNSHDATEALYRGYLEKSLGGIGEIHFANAARAVISEFPNNRELGFMAMVQILSGKIRLQKGSEAGTPKKLARLIDQNWDQAKKLLYNGFVSVWLRYVKQTQLAAAANDIQIRHKNEWDIGLEEFVQKLDPRIGYPKLETNPTHINFGKVFAETPKHIRLEIKNAGRGFLYGNIRLTSKLLGLELSSTIIRGNSVFTLKLNASYLTANRTHHTDLIVETNGGKLTLPISYYVHPIPFQNDKIFLQFLRRYRGYDTKGLQNVIASGQCGKNGSPGHRAAEYALSEKLRPDALE